MAKKATRKKLNFWVSPQKHAEIKKAAADDKRSTPPAGRRPSC
jgi:hypothetical protein